MALEEREGPFIQFFPGDFLKDPCVQVLSFEARAVWLFMILLMHDSVKRGYLITANGKQMTSKQLANALQISEARVNAAWAEMEEAGTFSKTEESIIYCRRMARATELSGKRSQAGRKGGRKAKRKQTPSTPLTRASESESESQSESEIATSGTIVDSPVGENFKTTEHTLSPTPLPRAEEGGEPSAPELWRGFLFAAQQASMPVAEGQIRSLERTFARLPANDRRAAIAGIEIRLSTGEYADAHFVPTLKRYLGEKLWTARLRPGPKSQSSSVEQRREAGNREFERMMQEDLTRGQRKIQSA